jgi:AcrR family transcriptional regulator
VSNSARVEPQQERATRRLANFLDVAAVLFAEIGYEATTMTAIVERSGSGSQRSETIPKPGLDPRNHSW